MNELETKVELTLDSIAKIITIAGLAGSLSPKEELSQEKFIKAKEAILKDLTEGVKDPILDLLNTYEDIVKPEKDKTRFSRDYFKREPEKVKEVES